MESGHRVKGSFSGEFFGRSAILRRNGGLKSQVVEDFGKRIAFFDKKTPCGKIFTTSQIHVFYVNVVKFGWPEVGKVVRCTPDKRKQNFASLSRYRFSADRAQNLPGPPPDNVLRVLEMSSKSVHLWRSYIAEHVNTVETHRKVFPIFGRSLALSWIIIRWHFSMNLKLFTVFVWVIIEI